MALISRTGKRTGLLHKKKEIKIYLRGKERHFKFEEEGLLE